jgi:hypothetical protein
VVRELYQAAKGIDGASTKLARLVKQFENEVNEETGEVTFGIGARYEFAVERELLAIVDQYEAQGKRPPAEDIRTARAKAIVRKKEAALYVSYLQALTEMKALRSWISQQREVISAKQTVFNGLRSLGA